MSRFSERFGYKPPKVEFQKDAMDSDLRNSLWNAITLCYWKHVLTDFYHNQKDYQLLFQRLWADFFKLPLNTKPFGWPQVHEAVRKWYFDKAQWYEVYDFVEFIPANFDGVIRNEEFFAMANQLLERELSAYRFVDGRLAPITNEHELESVRASMEAGGQFEPVSRHFDAAVRLLADRKNPDFRNSIKESICAVEAACQIISGESNATLGAALKILGKRGELHSSLRAAFDKLYGYTSDAQGIRHALLDEPDLTFDDAKFMLISCSAFVNYLVTRCKIVSDRTG